MREPEPKYQIGKGKVEELKDLVKELDVKKIIFDNDMKIVQMYNLAKRLGVEVIDRFQLILELFNRRAFTSEAKFQIKLAELRYELPHAKEKVRLAKLSEQPGFLGLGRYEIDLYYENIQRQISHVQKKIKGIKDERRLHRTHRRDLGFPLISLAGYTNAGKSSLFNTLANETVPVDAGLFTTLSTKTRIVEFFNKKALLTDTVGFIDRLPLTLIEAFQSTLEETVFSDLIILVVDLNESHEEIERKLLCCLDTIQKIGAEGIPIITAINKIDLLSDFELQHKVELLKDAPNLVPISAVYKTHIHLLKQQILNNLNNYVQVSVSLPVTNDSMSFLSWLHERVDVHEVKYRSDTLDLVFEAVPWFAEKVKSRTESLGGELKR